MCTLRSLLYLMRMTLLAHWLDAGRMRYVRGMPNETREVRPGPHPKSVRTTEGKVLEVPSHWVLIPPGDPGLTRRVKKAGPTWTVKEKRGRRMFSQGVWTDGSVVAGIRAALEAERADPAYQKKLDAARQKRERDQEAYAAEFRVEVEKFLAFAPRYAQLGKGLSYVITEHGIDVGSGTVARTKRIPIEKRVEAATIAWFRHQTTEYDDMKIPRVKGMRREVRRLLAERSRKLLENYRKGRDVDPETCPLSRALAP